MTAIWNAVVRDADAFPQTDELSEGQAREFFASQNYCGVAEEDGRIFGLYILHPNNIGRCGHLANASYAVAPGFRGRGIGRALVLDSLDRGRALGFGVLQFNAVVAENVAARKLYESLGFVPLGIVPGGFRRGDGSFADVALYYFDLR